MSEEVHRQTPGTERWGTWEMLGNISPVPRAGAAVVKACPGAGGATEAARGRNAAAGEGIYPALEEVRSGVPFGGAASKAGIVSMPHSGTSGEERLRARARIGAQRRLVVWRGVQTSKR